MDMDVSLIFIQEHSRYYIQTEVVTDEHLLDREGACHVLITQSKRSLRKLVSQNGERQEVIDTLANHRLRSGADGNILLALRC